MKEKIFEELREIIYDYLGDDEIEINDDSRFVEDIGLSSLDLISIVGSIEDTFNIKVLDKDVPNIKTIKDAVEYIKAKTNS
ncbi:MAG: acyl carrier protein [Erysipelotrichaceae bacterium]|nr:acyl carrier protein [Erysipelotrichaceae bacterium]